MAENKMCPHCGSQMFMATITRGCLVETTTDPENPYKILREGKDKYDIEIVKCARCKEDIKKEDLVEGVKCKECGRIVGPMDINSDGICHVCTAIHERSELANASREDLIQMLLNAEKKANPVAARMEKQMEKAEEANAAMNPPADTVLEEVTTKEKPKTKTGRGKSNKKKKDAASEATETPVEEVVEETVQENPVVEESVAEAVNDIANQQEAPFPEVDSSIIEPIVSEELDANVPEGTPVLDTVAPVPAEEPIGSDFKMFDDAEDAF